MQTHDIPIHVLHDINPFDFKIERIDHVNHYNPLRVHRHDYFEIFLFERGDGHHLIDFEQVPILDRQIHFVTPGQAHQVNRSADPNGFVLLFSSEFYHSNRERSDFLFQFPLFYHKTGNPTIVLPPDEFEDCWELVENMLQVFSSRHSQKNSILHSYLNIFLCNCLDYFERQESSPSHKSAGWAQFQQFQIAVEKHFKSLHEVAEYAKHLAISPRQLNESSKKFAGVSAVEFIHQRLALEAKRSLYYSNANISEIGFELGFEDPTHFSRFVRKCTGRAPTDWRKAAKV